MVCKRDGRREPFDAGKLLTGMQKAVAHRQVPLGEIQALVGEIEARAREEGPEVTSGEIGRMVLAGLRELDEVAYLTNETVFSLTELPRRLGCPGLDRREPLMSRQRHPPGTRQDSIAGRRCGRRLPGAGSRPAVCRRRGGRSSRRLAIRAARR